MSNQAWILALALVLTLGASRAPALPQGPRSILTEKEKLLPYDGKADALFGAAVAVHDDILVVGSPRDSDLGVEAGAAYVFERSGSTWIETQKLLVSDGDTEDQFGFSVAMAGDTIAIGAPFDDHLAYKAGSAYVYVRTPGGWEEQAKLLASVASEVHHFGWAVDLSGDSLIVGAPDASGGEISMAYIFHRTNAVWTEQAKLVASHVQPNTFFGESVSIDGDAAVVGAELDDKNGPLSGAAFAFLWDGSQWVEHQRLEPSIATSHFGQGVSISPDTLFVGAHNQMSGDCVFVFEKRGSHWIETQILSPEYGSNRGFGAGLRVSGTRAVIGASADDAGCIPSKQYCDTGAAYVYSRDRGTWRERARIVPSDPGERDRFGWAIDVHAGHVFAGAPYNDDLGADSGSVYAFLFAQAEMYCTGKVNSLGCTPAIDYAGYPSAAADSGFAVYSTNVRNQKEGVLLYSLEGRDIIPFQGGFLCLVSPIRRTLSQSSGGHLHHVSDCSGGWRMDMNAYAAGQIGGAPDPALRLPGTYVHCQWWGRDPGAISNSALTDALQYVIGP